MSSGTERVFITGATGDIGSEIVRHLVNKGINTTAYARNETKAKDLFKDELKTGLLTIALGDYSTLDAYEKAIKGHTRLFILLLGNFSKPTYMGEVKEVFGKIAYKHGVRQIVDLSSVAPRLFGKQGILGYIHQIGEDRLWNLAEEDPKQRSLVLLRPAFFMTNHYMGDDHHIKDSNKIIACGAPSAALSWIDPKDIGECAAVILTDPVEKHDRLVYEMGAEMVSNEQRAAIFTKILGKTITYEQVSPIQRYKMLTKHGLAHSLAYDLISFETNDGGQITTPQLSILLNRPLRTLEEWVKENAKDFQ